MIFDDDLKNELADFLKSSLMSDSQHKHGRETLPSYHCLNSIPSKEGSSSYEEIRGCTRGNFKAIKRGLLHKSQQNVYKDANHKLEMALALTEFEAVCGFIGSEIKERLHKMGEWCQEHHAAGGKLPLAPSYYVEVVK
ncbi:mannose-6-phosphate isomerase, type I [Artemisia annua]|uniref:Mannose-6-phosphate isomerase, type I n=1 Tax=Artemisia annua TaxID=35608 RepID=A0A2U1NBL3_ARTAN|nr:mannose-6-phosphate isomerase, type I [Artemisia annua]